MGASVISIIIDAVIVIIAILFIIIQARRGFARTLVEVVGCVLAVYLAFTFSGALAQKSFDAFFRDNITASVNESVGNLTKDNAKKSTDAIYNAIPKSVSVFCGDEKAVKSQIEAKISSVDLSKGNVGGIVADKVISPVYRAVATVIIGILMFIILMIAVHFLAKAVNFIFKAPILSGVNRFFGGVFGLVKGAAIVCGLVFAVSLINSVSSAPLWFFTPEVINGTFIFKFIYSISPFLAA